MLTHSFLQWTVFAPQGTGPERFRMNLAIGSGNALEKRYSSCDEKGRHLPWSSRIVLIAAPFGEVNEVMRSTCVLNVVL